MTPTLAYPDGAVYHGDCRAVLAALPAESVQVVCTSPPYFGLRRYAGLPDSVWGGDAACEHEWGNLERGKRKDILPEDVTTLVARTGTDNRQNGAATNGGRFCQRCGCWKGQLGNEPTVDLFLAHLLDVFRAVKRVLRPDGVCWVNLGDGYAGGKTGRGDHGNEIDGRRVTDKFPEMGVNRPVPEGMKQKDLMLVPERFAIAMQADGWYVRSRIVWAKTSAMPECLDPETHVFVKFVTGRVARITLQSLYLLRPATAMKILTPTGWRPILNVWETSKHEVATFEAAKVSRVRCSVDHRWPVSNDRRREAIHEKRTDELRAEGYQDYLLHHTIDEWLDGEYTRELWGVTLDYEMGWLLGLYAAEGGFGEVRGHRCKLTMHRNESETLARAIEIVERRFGAKVSHRQVKNYESIRFASELWHRLAPYIVPGKCTDKAVSLDVALNAPREFRVGLWEGYLAGDGSERPRGVSASSASRGLRDSMAVVASSIGIVTSKGDYVQHDKRTGKDYGHFTLWTPYVEHRQQKKGTNAKQLTIRNLEIDQREMMSFGVRMIDVEVEGGLFLIDDGLVTHNSVHDRPTSAHETIWMLTKAARYFYDAEAVRVAAEYGRRDWTSTEGNLRRLGGDPERINGTNGATVGGKHPETGANLRNVWLDTRDAPLDDLWVLGPEPYKEAHFATFPTAIPKRAILAATSERGACAECGAPWKRQTKPSDEYAKYLGKGYHEHLNDDIGGMSQAKHAGWKAVNAEYHTVGWSPSCTCNAPTVPQTVLDPFLGSGTTAVVARSLGRHFIGVEGSSDYLELCRKRIESTTLALDERPSVVDAPRQLELIGGG